MSPFSFVSYSLFKELKIHYSVYERIIFKTTNYSKFYDVVFSFSFFIGGRFPSPS
ncbi:hypothetical protein OMAG_000713 [Candidatus Omnitrophus magneticus]|uniref:Uncharacterized protein n=1 Tax=Candidatus Omnitrophus magneticus TaxID=1609969 RepID=A0A0F0CVG3_9BACT|nr:hypothetical protein OMAG_000713 [Candidatus Omnitrophus magneticus]